jgi:hypothetical protein
VGTCGEPVSTPHDGSVTAYRYALSGPVPEAVTAELRRVHDLRNQLVEAERAYEAAIAAAWEENPQVAPVLAALAEAEETAAQAKKALLTARQRAGKARKDKNRAALATTTADRDAAAAEYKTARDAAKAARERLRQVKAQRWPEVQRAITRAAEERDAAVKATYGTFRDAGGYWASWADVVSHHKAAQARVRATRASHQAARQRFSRWNGTGSVTVQIPRGRGVSAAERAHVAALRRAGLSPREIQAALQAGLTAAEAAGIGTAHGQARKAALEAAADRAKAEGRPPGRSWSPQTIARMKAEGAEKPPDPPCSPAVLASGEGRWASQIRIGPELPGDYYSRPRAARRRLAREGTLAIRTGSAAQAVVSEMPVTIHRPISAGADVKLARLTVTRCGPDLGMHVTLTARIARPAARAAGQVVAVHTGWRSLPDGCLRVAVAAGAGPVPPHLAATGTVRTRDGWAEVIIPAEWRAEAGRTEAARSRRDRAAEAMRQQVAQWVTAHPADTLPSADEVRRWRSRGHLVTLMRACQAGEHGNPARLLGRMLAKWEKADRHAWRNEAHSRRRLARRRDDTWGQVAAWLCAGAREIRTDTWDMPSLSRRAVPGTDDDPQATAARANRALAAPGALRARILTTAAREGVTVAAPAGPATGPQAHLVCGTPLAAEDRRDHAAVLCHGCGAVVDQDENMVHLMLAR